MKNIKSKIQFIIISSFIILLSGCTGSANKHFNKKIEFMQNAQYTKVIKIVDKSIVKAIVNITYLNSANSDRWDNGKQNFIIGTYIISEDKKCCKLDLTIQKESEVQLDKNNIEYEEISLTPVETKVLAKNDPLYENIPLRNNWAEYQLVSYDSKDFADIKEFTFQLKEVQNEDTSNNTVTTIFTKE